MTPEQIQNMLDEQTKDLHILVAMGRLSRREADLIQLRCTALTMPLPLTLSDRFTWQPNEVQITWPE